MSLIYSFPFDTAALAYRCNFMQLNVSTEHFYLNRGDRMAPCNEQHEIQLWLQTVIYSLFPDSGWITELRASRRIAQRCSVFLWIGASFFFLRILAESHEKVIYFFFHFISAITIRLIANVFIYLQTPMQWL